MGQHRPRRFMRIVFWLIVGSACCPAPFASAGDEPAVFYRGVNLNGPALVISGHRWDAGDASGVSTEGLSGFENQSVPLIPATDENRAKMIRSSRWAPSGKASIRLTDVPSGVYSVYVYVWEDNDSQTFDVAVSGKVFARNYASGNAGHWDRLGPWIVDVREGAIELTAAGGHANLSGIEVWRGRLSEKDHPLSGQEPVKPVSPTDSAVAVLLARNCLECHNASDRKGGLDLTRPSTAIAGGDSGSAIAAGDLNSLLLKQVETDQMPPRGRTRLSTEDRQLLRKWIQEGAKWSADPIDPFLYTSDRRAGYNWWSLQTVKRVDPPRVANGDWPRNSIDNFILQRLEQADIRPAPQADRRTLIRRLTFDLTGLPPSPEEVQTFLDDPDPQAYEKLVDRLLDSPRYGERWARHWLDIVRFGESQGFERNKLRPNVWKYRDFVVEAFNSDMPYDEFIRWQIAGDVLHPDDPLAVIASGFLALGPYDLTAYNNGTPDMRAFAREEELEGLVGSIGQTFLGLTVNCSRCHDHKFDPISQREYYQFSAAIGGTFQGDERDGKPSTEQRMASVQAQIAGLASLAESVDPQEKRTRQDRRARLESLKGLLSGGPVHTTVPKQPGPWRVFARGDFKQPGQVVAPGGIAAVTGVSADWRLAENAREGDRRQALAEWLADADNPLTARVIVNRLWGYHFGDGLVRTPSDFGFQGGLPSHPELLDWLAHELVHPSEGHAWGLRRIQRLIVTSAAYRQSSRPAESGRGLNPMDIDADNRLIWRHQRQRLEAETFRDALLAVSGELDGRIGGPGYRDFKITSAGNNETYTVFDAIGPEFNRRSLYRTWVRAGTSPLLDTLDCPDPSVPTPRRSVTSTPLQALSLLNDAAIEHYATKFAERLSREAGNDTARQIERGYMLSLGRMPGADELKFAQQFVTQHGLTQFCLVLMNTNEFLFVD